VALASPAPFSIPSSRQNNYYNYNNNNNKMMTTTTPERSPVPLQSHLHVSFAYGAAGWVVGGASDTQPSDAPGCSGMLTELHPIPWRGNAVRQLPSKSTCPMQRCQFPTIKSFQFVAKSLTSLTCPFRPVDFPEMEQK